MANPEQQDRTALPSKQTQLRRHVTSPSPRHRPAAGYSENRRGRGSRPDPSPPDTRVGAGTSVRFVPTGSGGAGRSPGDSVRIWVGPAGVVTRVDGLRTLFRYR